MNDRVVSNFCTVLYYRTALAHGVKRKPRTKRPVFPKCHRKWREHAFISVRLSEVILIQRNVISDEPNKVKLINVNERVKAAIAQQLWTYKALNQASRAFRSSLETSLESFIPTPGFLIPAPTSEKPLCFISASNYRVYGQYKTTNHSVLQALFQV